MTTALKYTGAAPIWGTTITGKPTRWYPGQIQDVSDADAALYIAAGNFVYAPADESLTPAQAAAGAVGLVAVKKDGTQVGPDGGAVSGAGTSASPRTAYRVIGGVADKSGAAPHPNRILSPKTMLPAMLWEPGNLAVPGTLANASAAVDTNFVCRSRYGSMKLTSTVATSNGNVGATWSGLSINFGSAVSAGYRVGVLYVVLPHLTQSINITFTNGARQRILQYNAPVARKGLVALPFALPGLSASMQTSVNNALVSQGTTTFSEFNGGFDASNFTVTGIQVAFNTFGQAGTTIAVGDQYAVVGIDVLPVVKPAVLVTYDKVNGAAGIDDFTMLVDLHASRKLAGSVRYHGIYDNASPSIEYINYAIASGYFDCFNGTLTRSPTTGQTVQDAYREFGVNAAQMQALGLPSTAFFTVPGNSTWPDGTFEQVCSDVGLRYSRASGLHAIAHGYGGVCNPLSMGCSGMEGPIGPSGAITMTQWLQGLVDAGVHGSTFAHGFYAAGQSAQSRITLAQMTTALDSLKTFQDGGLVDVVGCGRMARILDGLE